ncbi:MAG TPA: hypothetical protein VK724_27490 [Bryobacteraceae bacterium]|nr:hypothetical protein [Bryobacteraceae bacterium]
MARQALVILIVVAAFGVLVPLYKGFGFLDPRIIAAYACMALLFVAPASAEMAAAHGTDAPRTAILGKIALIVAWGWGMTIVILVTAIVTLNLMARRGGLLAPPWGFLVAILTFSLSSSIAIAILGAVLARRFSASAVKNILRTGFLVILLAVIFGSRVLSESVQLEIFDRFSTRRALTHLAWESSAVFVVVAALLMVPLLKVHRQPS